MHHSGPVGETLDVLDPARLATRKQCRTFGHDPLVPVFRLKFRKLQTSEGTGLLMQRHALRAKPQLPV
jgi:hypothetical protein